MKRKQTVSEAWAELSAAWWAIWEPPLIRLLEWMNRRVWRKP